MAGRRDWGDDDDDDEPYADATGRGESRVDRVNGPPGTGKTTWLARQVDRAADKYHPSAVVVASLTRAAAAEVAGRKTRLPRENIGTLHSHAYRALERPEIAETTKGLKSWNEWVPSSSLRIGGSYAVDVEAAMVEQTAGFETKGAEMLAQMGVLRARMTDRRLWPMGIQRFAKMWDQWKEEKGFVDFTDLIERAIDEVPVLSQKPEVIMLDEAQDMSKLDMRLAVQWGMAARRLIVVGDADQNLYQWRGSDPEAFYTVGGVDVKDFHVTTLSQSYRVPKYVHEEAVSMIERIPDREQVDYKPRHSERSDLESPVAMGTSERVGHTWADPGSLIRSLSDDLDDGGQTVMVLTSCGYMLKPLITELRAKGIPFHNPYKTNQGAWNPLRGGRRLLSFLKPDPDVWGEDADMYSWKELRAWMEVMQAKGVWKRGSKSLVESRDRIDRFKEDLGDEKVPLNYLLDLLETDEGRMAVLAHDVEWWESNLKHKDRKVQQYPLQVARRYGAKKLLEQPRLVLGTIHSVKGGEADKVYVFPDLSSIGYYQGYKKPGSGRDSVHRLFYVAMTRAYEDLRLCKPSGGEAIHW